MQPLTQENLTQLKQLRTELTRFTAVYKFALDEVNTKINILKDEFSYIHDYNPIEHCSSRLKSPESILKKIYKKNIEFSLGSIKENIKDIAGIRIICSFKSDIYALSEMIQNQKDIELIERKDYIQNPKPNGYQSLHLIVKVPVFLSDREEKVCVEIQIRTIAMDFWASLEHKIYYKYDKEIPNRLATELKEAADSAAALDEKMEKIHSEVKELKNKQLNELDEVFDVSSMTATQDKFMQGIIQQLLKEPKKLE
ncbi:GTP pyrophosphokinase family protein [Terribacillus sp. FSL K6-0262]|uniref:GTP pyrophosphokinase n=1 Tax=Terribacillus sp. FSL K6-0262 TaxID=2921447 RepID=UPI0030EBE52F